MKHLALLFVYLLSAAVCPAQQSTVFAVPLSGISAATASDPIRNIGQAMHTIQVSFPAENAQVASIQVRLEFARDDNDDTVWIPAGPDIIVAPVLDNGDGATDVYAYQDYYGVFRAVRVRSVVNTPGAELMTVRYIGHLTPVVPFITLRTDRWAF